MKKRMLDVIDKEVMASMKNVEKKCRKIKLGTIPFSPKVAKWIKRLQIYQSLLQKAQGIAGNLENPHHATLRAGISNPFSLSENDILLCFEVCEKDCDCYHIHGKETEDDTCEIASRQQWAEGERGFWQSLR